MDMIEVTGVDLRRFARKVYQLSEPTNKLAAADSMSAWCSRALG
jgi:hypothetical protein